MKSPTPLLLSLSLSLALVAPRDARARTAPPAPPSREVPANLPRLMEVFTVDETPGAGTLVFTRGQKPTPITLGKKDGFYGVGMVFDGTVLPPSIGEAYRKRKILQIGLGSLKSRPGTHIAQFGALTILSGTVPKRATTYQLLVPNGKDNPLAQMALMMFSSPDTPAQQSDEEKLKTTYFADNGTLVVTPVGLPKPIEINNENQKLAFMAQLMKIDVQTNLVTPFNAQENDLSGSITLPVYWPNGRAARALTQKIARVSLSAGGPVPLSSDYGSSEIGTKPPKKK